MKLSDLDSSKFISVCVYGNSGTGKTCFATSFPGPVWVADFDGKISSAANYWKDKDPKRLDQIDFDSFTLNAQDGSIRAYQKFLIKLRALEADAIAGQFKFQTVVIDSLTTLTEHLMVDCLEENPGVKRFIKGIPVLQDYMTFNTRFKDLLRRLICLPANIVVIGHIALEKDEVTGEVLHRPALSGKLPELLPTFFQEVYRAYSETSKEGVVSYLAQTRSSGKFVTRTQLPKLPNIIPLDYKAIATAMVTK